MKGKNNIIVALLFLICGISELCQAAVYELKQDGVTCIVLNTTLSVQIKFLNTSNKNVTTTWTLGKPSSTSIKGTCAAKVPNRVWSEIWINVTKSIVGIRFVSLPTGQVVMSNMSLTVNIVNSTQFKNPLYTGQVTFAIEKLNLSLSSNIERFECQSPIDLPIAARNRTLFPYAKMTLRKGLVIQAFNLTNGTLSDKVAHCPQDQTTTTITPVTTSAPPSQPKLLNLTVLSTVTHQPCLRIQSRLQLDIPYMRPGRVSQSKIYVPEVFSVSGFCGDERRSKNDKSYATRQNLTVTFFKNWKLTFKLNRSTADGPYGLTGVLLSYNLNDSTVFPGASNVGKQLFGINDNSVVADIPSKGYYSCQSVSAKLDGPVVPGTSEKLVIVLTASDLRLQAFRVDNSTSLFTGSETKCDQKHGHVDNIVPIVVGASLAGLVVIVLLAYLISRRRSAAGQGYQSV